MVDGGKFLCKYCEKFRMCGKTDCDGKEFSAGPTVSPNYGYGSTMKTLLSWARVKKLVYLRQDGNCSICKEPLLIRKWHAHHIREKWAGGSNHPKNIIGLCEQCHANTLGSHNRAIMEQLERRKYNKFWKKIEVIK